MQGKRTIMVGRDEELESLFNGLSDVLEGKGTFFLISGEAGIGKTRLCEDLETKASSIGCRILIGKCMPGPPLPFLPIIEALKSVSISVPGRIDASLRGPISSQLLTASPSEEYVDARSENERFIFSMLDAFRVTSSKSPLVLIIEDLHWVDSSTLQFLLFLARNLSGIRMLIVCTYRPEEIIIVEGAPHPLTEWIPSLKKSANCKVIELDSLKIEELSLAIRTTFDVALDKQLTNRIAKESGGNPLFALELVRYLSETGALEEVNGVWGLIKGISLAIPSNIRELITQRIERVPKEQRRILELASVIGDSFTTEVLENIVSLKEGSLASWLADIEKRQLIYLEKKDFYRFTHEKIRRVTYEHISELRRKELHRLVGENFESLPDRNYLTAELALHFERAGIFVKAMRYSLLAGEDCLRRMAMMESMPFFNNVLRGDSNVDGYYCMRIQALEGMGTAQLELSNYASAAHHFQELLSMNPEAKVRARSLRKCAECYGPTRLGKGSSEKLLQLCHDAEAIKEIEPGELGEIWHYRTMINIWAGRVDEARECAWEAERIFREAGPMERLALQMTFNLTIDITSGQVGRAIEKSRAIWDIYREHPYPSGELELLNYLGIALTHQDRNIEAKVTLQRSIELAEKLGDYPLVCWGYIYLALVYGAMGDLESAVDLGQEAKQNAKLTESPYMLASADAALALNLMAVGRVGEAEALVSEARELTKDFTWTIRTPAKGLIDLAMAMLSTAKGEEGADKLFQEAQQDLHGAAFSLYLEGRTLQLHGESLIARGERTLGLERLEQAKEIFSRIGNERRTEQVDGLPN